MAKRKVTLTLDEDVVRVLERVGPENLSATVNAALITEVGRISRLEALGALLDSWDEIYGPPSEEAVRYAVEAFAELDGTYVAESA